MLLQYLEQLNKLRIVLASSSPRRLSIMRGVGLQCVEVCASTFAEDLPKGQFRTGGEYALSTARQKAQDVAEKLAERKEDKPVSILLAADTVVTVERAEGSKEPLEIIEKAVDADDAKRILHSLSGRSHEVWTGVVVGHRGRSTGSEWHWHEFSVRTIVSVAPLSRTLIDAYVDQHPDAWRGKAGAYGIQDLGGCFIEGIQGDYYNVMGLPLQRVCSELCQLVESGELAE